MRLGGIYSQSEHGSKEKNPITAPAGSKTPIKVIKLPN
jgi:hypothetical protein